MHDRLREAVCVRETDALPEQGGDARSLVRGGRP